MRVYACICVMTQLRWVDSLPDLHAIDKVEEDTLSLRAELKVSKNQVVLVKEDMVDAHRLLLAQGDKELAMQQHHVMADLEL